LWPESNFLPHAKRHLPLKPALAVALCAAMKVRLLLLLAVAVCAPVMHAAFINGHAYTALAGWAPANGFRLQARAGGVVSYTNRAALRLVFEKDSRTAKINSVNVAMSFPVACDKGEIFVSQLDLAKTVEPLVFPAVVPKKITTIVLDSGHGGKDTGNRVGFGFFGHSEKTYTLLLAQELQRQLRAAGFNVLLTRNTDTFVELPARPDLANRRNADLFISLHFNATESGKAEVSGPETYCITPVGAASSNAQGEGANYGATTANRVEGRSLLLAYAVQRALVKSLPVEDRSVRRARFAVLRDAEMPAILVESGYMTHPVEGKKIFTAAYRQQLAAAIVKGVLNYQKLTVPPTDERLPAGNPPAKTKKRKKS
jgi:N-acetylmuramoyl-L-alanine amidase